MSDINSSTKVTLGDVKLSEKEAEGHLKKFNDYWRRKKSSWFWKITPFCDKIVMWLKKLNKNNEIYSLYGKIMLE